MFNLGKHKNDEFLVFPTYIINIFLILFYVQSGLETHLSNIS